MGSILDVVVLRPLGAALSEDILTSPRPSHVSYRSIMQELFGWCTLVGIVCEKA